MRRSNRLFFPRNGGCIADKPDRLVALPPGRGVAWRSGLWFVLLSLCAWAGGIRAEIDTSRLSLPPGFAISVLTEEVPNARQMALADDGTLYVGTRRAGNLYAVTGWQDPNQLPSRTKVRRIDQDLVMPSGLVWHAGDLYVGALNRILRYPNIGANLDQVAPPEVITDDLPSKRHHGWKYLSMGPDGALYVPVGAPCNICKSVDPRFASILRMDPKTGTTTIYAAGVRNSVGLAWHPTTGKLWFTDNGRDSLGDDVPADEINVVDTPSGHFGYPYWHAGDVADPKFGKGHAAQNYQQPILKVQAHSAALGIDFYTGEGFPARYNNALFVAEHGSWNRSAKVGYQISVVFDTPQGPQYAPFITGWLRGEENWGRPNDVLVTPDGELLISDDQTGSIYRVNYQTSTP